MKAIKRIVAKTGEYQKDGEKKYKYSNMGTLFKREDGSVCAKFEHVPVGNYWTGWVDFYDIEQQRDTAKQQQVQQSINAINTDDFSPF